jgi:hypothetical protein
VHFPRREGQEAATILVFAGALGLLRLWLYRTPTLSKDELPLLAEGAGQ